MSDIYGQSEPTGGVGPGRDAITAALMNIRMPPPIPPAQALGSAPPTGFGSGLSPQPAALGAAPQPGAQMGLQQGLGLPGISPPGQLPQGMAPSLGQQPPALGAGPAMRPPGY